MSGQRRIGWLDLSCGASGDMLLGALVGAGVPLEVPTQAIDALGLPIRLEARAVRRGGLAAAKVDVVLPPEPGTPNPDLVGGSGRSWADLRVLLDAAPLDEPVRARAVATFGTLARAEGAVHGIDPADVHFHEVGALDAIADVVGVCACLAHLGLDELIATPIALGGGRATMAHGVLPIPGPAVLELLRASGAPAAGGPVAVELCTPTGAALVVTAVTGYGHLPALRVTAIGYGAGTRDLPDRPNVVRLVLGDALTDGARPHQHGHQAAASAEPDHAHGHAHGHDPSAEPPGANAGDVAVVRDVAVPGGIVVCEELVLEANVDDLDPRVWPSALAALLAAGAADAWLTPILMKKGRPAHTLRALVVPERAAAVRAEIFRQTSTLGLRELSVRKHARSRGFRTVDVAGQPIRVKVSPGVDTPAEPPDQPARSDDAAARPGGPTASQGIAGAIAQPEWDDVVEAAARLGWPARQVLAAAAALAEAGRWSDPAR